MSSERDGRRSAEASLVQRATRRVDSNKLSLPIVLGFFGCLALMCAAAAAVGYLLPYIARH